MTHIAIINGPNLNLVGIREPELYGTLAIDQYLEALRTQHPDLRISIHQSNHEGEIIDRIQRLGFEADGLVLNPGGYSHTSVAIHDALRAVKAPAVEVHISNIHAREAFRQHSITGAACVGVISGLGLRGYDLAIEWLRKEAAPCR